MYNFVGYVLTEKKRIISFIKLTVSDNLEFDCCVLFCKNNM